MIIQQVIVLYIERSLNSFPRLIQKEEYIGSSQKKRYVQRTIAGYNFFFERTKKC